MANAEERMKILKMIEEGKISAEDGAKLLVGIERRDADQEWRIHHGRRRLVIGFASA